MTDKLGAKVAGFTVLGLVVLVAVAWTVLYLWSGDKMPRSAAVEGVDIAGLSPAQAESRLRSTLAERTTEPIVVSYGDGRSPSGSMPSKVVVSPASRRSRSP